MSLNRPYYILNDAGEPVRCNDVLTWGRWFGTANRTVASTKVGPYRVSTIFLAIDHNFLGRGRPILYETMVFGLPGDGEDAHYYSRRYATKAQAIKGHEAVVAQVKADRNKP